MTFLDKWGQREIKDCLETISQISANRLTIIHVLGVQGRIGEKVAVRPLVRIGQIGHCLILLAIAERIKIIHVVVKILCMLLVCIIITTISDGLEWSGRGGHELSVLPVVIAAHLLDPGRALNWHGHLHGEYVGRLRRRRRGWWL